MPATKTLAITALLAVTVSIAGCNSSKKASSAATGTAALPAAAASAAAAIQSAAAAASAPAAAAVSTPAAAGSTAAACPLTGAQVTTALGVTYADPTVAYGICSYLSSSTGNAFTINIHAATGVFDFNGTLATAKQDQGADTSTTIPNLGDKAAGTGQEIVVQSSGKTIDIRNVDEAPWTQSIALAKLVIASLH
jgi:hypothetical protein